MTKFDLIIFGAGPIGLTLANLLGKKHFKILVIDKTKELVFNTNRYIAISNKTNKISFLTSHHGLRVIML